MTDLDLTLFLVLNSSSTEMGNLAMVAWIVAKLLIYAIPVHVILLWTRGTYSERRGALIIVSALSIAVIASFTIGKFLPVDRPFVAGVGNTLMPHRASPSFPSNHALIFLTYASVLYFLQFKRTAIAAAMVGLAVAWSRIYVGVHYPFDMIGAAALAPVATLLAFQVDKAFGAFAERTLYAIFLGLLQNGKKIGNRLR